MFLFNVTTHLDEAQEADWLLWMQEEHIPTLLKGDYFNTATPHQGHGRRTYGRRYLHRAIHHRPQSHYQWSLRQTGGRFRGTAYEKIRQ